MKINFLLESYNSDVCSHSQQLRNYFEIKKAYCRLPRLSTEGQFWSKKLEIEKKLFLKCLSEMQEFIEKNY